MPKYNLDNISDKFKVHMKNSFALLNSADCEPEGLKPERLLGKNAK